MNRGLRLAGPTSTTVLGLVGGAVGIAVLWGTGQTFPFYPPPGIIILSAGALFITLAPFNWAPGAGVLLGLFVVVGFLIEGVSRGDGCANLAGEQGAGRAAGQAIQLIGVITAVVAGAIATRVNRRQSGSR